MIRLDQAGTRALSLITAQNGADVTVGFSDYTVSTGAYVDTAPQLTTISSATTTTICATPASGVIRDIDYVNIKNTFAGSHTMTLQITSGSGGPFVQKTFTLDANESITFTHGGGYQAFTSSAGIKQGGVNGPSSSTDNAVARFNGTGGTSIQNSGVIIDDSDNVSGAVNNAWTGTTNASGTGNHTFAGPLVISGASAGQIVFPATQNASAGANTLDDYEEGTWTPTDASGAALSFASATGSYEKIGRQFRAGFAVTYPSTADASAAIIGGSPVTTSNNEYARQGFVSYSTETTAQNILTQKNSTTAAIVTNAGANVTNATMSDDTFYGTILSHV